MLISKKLNMGREIELTILFLRWSKSKANFRSTKIKCGVGFVTVSWPERRWAARSRWRIRQSSVDAFLNEQTEPSKPQTWET